EARRQLAVDEASGVRVTAYPTILQPFWRRVVAEGEGIVKVGFYSPLAPSRIAWTTYGQAKSPAVTAAHALPEIKLFAWFSANQTLWQSRPQGDATIIEVRDLRYGLPGGTEAGFWGVRVVMGADGAVLAPPEPFRDRPGPSLDTAINILRAAFLGTESAQPPPKPFPPLKPGAPERGA
ncbi:MAG: hypothetical protein K2Q10_02285, partial [Rhodospirillales bacterium]|nr:hypothetical protein [Rhodospirillales bacterium]